MKLGVVIPMYNEKDTVTATVRELREYLDALTADGRSAFDCWELLLSNDGSTDGCEKLAAAEAEGDARIRLCGTAENRGKGSAVRHGFAASEADVVVFTDCDLAYGVDQIGQIAGRLAESGKDIVIGSRALHPDGYAGYTALRRILSKTYLKIISLCAGFRLSDSQTGIKAFRGEVGRRIFSLCVVDRFAFDLEALMIADRAGYSIGEFPVTIARVREGRSKVSFVRDSARMVRDLFRMKKRISKLEL